MHGASVVVARIIPAVSACWYVAEASASSDASASCYRLSEDVGVFTVIVAELKLVQIEPQIFLRDIVIGADHAALEQRPERFQVVCVDLAAHIFMRLVIDVLMRESLMKFLIASGFVRGNKRNLV